MRGTTCSAPGKVLLAGGYLILDRPHAGSVLALDARFYSHVELHDFTDAAAVAAGSEAGSVLVEVHSPQFNDSRRYLYRPDTATPLTPLAPPAGGPPPSLWLGLHGPCAAARLDGECAALCCARGLPEP